MTRTTEYIPFRGKYCDIVRIDWDWFDYREGEQELPKVGAFCKKCARETAKPVFPIYMNGKPAYGLRCEKCGSEYPMYQSMFIERYVGYDIAVGHINPTHGTKSIFQTMDRKARQYYNDREKRVAEQMCKIMKYTPEEYQEKKKIWEEESVKRNKKFEREKAERQSRWEDEKRKEESNKRKELIDKGVLKYVKNIGLVNTETGEVVKL